MKLLAIMNKEKKELIQALDKLKEYRSALKALIDEGNKSKDDDDDYVIFDQYLY